MCRRHVRGMRSRWRDLPVPLSRFQTLSRHLRTIATVDDVVRYSGMVRHHHKLLVQHSHCFLLIGKGGIAKGRRCQQRERVKRSRVVILRILLIQLGHRIRVSGNPRLKACLLIILVELCQCVQVIALALGFCANLLPLLHQLRSTLQRSLAGTVPDLVPGRHCLAPIRHRAPRIGRCNDLKLLLGAVVPEVMQQSDPAIERRLLRGRARYREINRAQLLVGDSLRLLCFSSDQGDATPYQQQQNRFALFHPSLQVVGEA